MAIYLPEKCVRGLLDCEPLALIRSDCDTSFICCGKNNGKTRKHKQDEFRHCWKSKEVDDMSDCDKRDLIDTISVLSQALSVDINSET